MSGNENYKESGYVGQIFGVDIHYPITRKEIRQLVKAESELTKELMENEGLSIYQARNDTTDQVRTFVDKLNDVDDQARILNLFAEEMQANTKALNDETAKINQETLSNQLDEANANAFWGWFAGIVIFFIIFFIIKGH